MTHNWGNYPKLPSAKKKYIQWRHQSDLFAERPVLPYGTGRSYGDSCLNNSGSIISTHYLNHFISFDQKTGVLRCESGVTLENILQLILPRGWILPVMPGTQYITVGGAIANDVHGKNHHVKGSFGCHVIQFELLRSNQERFICSAEKNADFFSATIGGLGLTGLITWVELQLAPLRSEIVTTQTIPFRGLEEFIETNKRYGRDHEFISSWLDCQSTGKNFGRGLFFAANFSEESSLQKIKIKPKKSVPFYFPSMTLNKFTIKYFNAIYFSANKKHQEKNRIQHFTQQLFPLDNLLHWNRIYGKRGFLQYQCVIPHENGLSAIRSLLKKITASNQGSFLSVLKTLGDITSPGMLSFPRPGISLALDFSFKGTKTLTLLKHLDDIVMQADGRVYPAKDACMSENAFKKYYPPLEKFLPYKDEGFSSSFWRRVTGDYHE